MTIQEAIQKAIEGGWKNEVDRDFALYKGQPHFALLDPLFWQAVGKSLGWGNEYGIDERDFWVGEINYPEVIKGKAFREIWRYNWNRLIDHLAEGKSIEDYFKNL